MRAGGRGHVLDGLSDVRALNSHLLHRHGALPSGAVSWRPGAQGVTLTRAPLEAGGDGAGRLGYPHRLNQRASHGHAEWEADALCWLTLSLM